MADRLPAVLEQASPHPVTIGCVIPARDEQRSIARLLESLLSQTRVPDVIHVVVTHTSDATVEIASRYAGPHEVATELGEQFTEVFVHDLGHQPGAKVGALNYGYTLVEGYDYLLEVAAGTVADAKVVEALEAAAVSDARIGGISVTSSARGTARPGQLSLLSTRALRAVMALNRQSVPWVKDGLAEGSLLTMQIRDAGYLTAICPSARSGREIPLRRVAYVAVPLVGAVVVAEVLSRFFRVTRRGHR